MMTSADRAAGQAGTAAILTVAVSLRGPIASRVMTLSPMLAHGRPDAGRGRAGESIGDEGDGDAALPGRDGGTTRHPEGVRAWRLELPVHPLGRTRRRLVGHRRRGVRPAHGAAQAHPPHRPPPGSGPPASPHGGTAAGPCVRHGRRGSRRGRGGSPPAAPHPAGCEPRPSQDRRAARDGRGRTTGRAAESGGSALPLGPAVFVEKRDPGFGRRSSAGRAGQADALRRIWSAWGRLRLSRFSAAMRSRSRSVGGGPGCCLRSRAGLAAPTGAAARPCRRSAPRSS